MTHMYMYMHTCVIQVHVHVYDKYSITCMYDSVNRPCVHVYVQYKRLKLTGIAIVAHNHT